MTDAAHTTDAIEELPPDGSSLSTPTPGPAPRGPGGPGFRGMPGRRASTLSMANQQEDSEEPAPDGSAVSEGGLSAEEAEKQAEVINEAKAEPAEKPADPAAAGTGAPTAEEAAKKVADHLEEATVENMIGAHSPADDGEQHDGEQPGAEAGGVEGAGADGAEGGAEATEEEENEADLTVDLDNNPLYKKYAHHSGAARTLMEGLLANQAGVVGALRAQQKALAGQRSSLASQIGTHLQHNAQVAQTQAQAQAAAAMAGGGGGRGGLSFGRSGGPGFFTNLVNRLTDPARGLSKNLGQVEAKMAEADATAQANLVGYREVNRSASAMLDAKASLEQSIDTFNTAFTASPEGGRYVKHCNYVAKKCGLVGSDGNADFKALNARINDPTDPDPLIGKLRDTVENLYGNPKFADHLKAIDQAKADVVKHGKRFRNGLDNLHHSGADLSGLDGIEESMNEAMKLKSDPAITKPGEESPKKALDKLMESIRETVQKIFDTIRSKLGFGGPR